MNAEYSLSLELLGEQFAVCRLQPEADLAPDIPFAFWAQTPQEKSLVCPEKAVPAEAARVKRGLRCLRVAGVLDLGLVGILARLATVLAQASVPLFAVSTWDTDYLFVPQDSLEQALAAFREAEIRVTDA